MLAYVCGLVAAAALSASLYVSLKKPFRFKNNGSGPDFRPSAAVAGGLMTIAVAGLVLALTL